jgi:adenylate cyclase
MEPKGFHRKLTAILSADVGGYSRLMHDDEAATVKTLEAYKQIISDLVKQHRGGVVGSPSDNLLEEFASVGAAVHCVVATQKELQARSAELPENRNGSQNDLYQRLLGNSFFIRLLGESPKKEVYQCPSS